MPQMDEFHSVILEGHWQGMNAHEIADELGADPTEVARIVDDFVSMGY